MRKWHTMYSRLCLHSRLCLLFLIALWLTGAESAAAQTPTPYPTDTLTLTVTTPITDWIFPAEGLQPYTYTKATDNPLQDAIEGEDLWHMARVALTTYELMDAQSWGLLALCILIPVALGLTYKIFTRPPEI